MDGFALSLEETLTGYMLTKPHMLVSNRVAVQGPCDSISRKHELALDAAMLPIVYDQCHA